MAQNKWTDERTAQLVEVVGSDVPVSVDTMNTAATALDVTVRSISGKLRKLGMEVDSTVVAKAPTFTAEQQDEITSFVNANVGEFTFGELAATLFDGSFSARQIQGVVLHLELNASIRPTEKQVVSKKYSDSEQETFITMANDGASLEDIASALGKSLNSARGKALSLSRAIEGFVIPKQAVSHAKVVSDPISELGDLDELTVEQIAASIDKTPKSVKGMLTTRGLVCADYDGAKRKAKIAATKAESQEAA